METEEVVNTLEILRREASKNAERAFYEGFLLGQQHAEKIYGKNEEE